MSQRRNIPYTIAHRLFYDVPERIADGASRLKIAGRGAPEGWSSKTIGFYRCLRPPLAQLPEQGWKIHVTATLANAEAVAEAVWDFCVRNLLPFKFLRSADAILHNNSKYWPRDASGKFCAIYPEPDRFEDSVASLDMLLKGQSGPYILSDVRYRSGPVFARYGSFVHRTCLNGEGEAVPAIRDPDGRLVPEYRAPAFAIPDFVELPAFLRPFVNPSPALDDLPFAIDGPLHFSNGGGIYRGTRREDGAAIALREARPHAGLDNNGHDARRRLRNEKATLERLAGLDCVPRLHDLYPIWEHEFLATEFVSGRTLLTEIIHRYPYAHPRPAAGEIAAYLGWVRDTFARIETAVAQIHAKGVEVADLHPGNIIVRPDGAVTVIDFECARLRGSGVSGGLGALGFAVSRPGAGGDDRADEVALGRILLMMLLPIVPILSLDPDKAGALVEIAGGLFPLEDEMARRLRSSAPTPDSAGPSPAFDAESWPELRSAIIAGILSRAATDRDDIIFRCDALQFAHGPASFAYGAAGILYAIGQVTGAVPPALVDRLHRIAIQGDGCRGLGFFDGLHGVAFALHALGRDELASDILAAALARPLPIGDGLFGGKAGVALNLLELGEAWSDEALLDRGTALGARLADAVRLEDGLPGQRSAGLMHGGSGLALLFLRLHARTGLDAHLDAAEAALRSDLRVGQSLPDGTFHLVKSPKYLIYLDGGSIGPGLVLERFLRLRPDEGLSEILDQIRRGCTIPFVMQPGLFQGRTGLIAALADSPRPQDRRAGRTQAQRLGWHALRCGGEIAFPGDGLTKFVDDLASGSAGVLLVLDALFGGRRPRLPFL